MPEGMWGAVEQLKGYKSKEECVRTAYARLTKRFAGNLFYVLTHFWKRLLTDLNANSGRGKKVFHCNTANYLPVRSEWFSENGIRNKRTRILAAKPYLHIKIGKKQLMLTSGKHHTGFISANMRNRQTFI